MQGAAMLGFRLLSRSIDQVPPPTPSPKAPHHTILPVHVSWQSSAGSCTHGTHYTVHSHCYVPALTVQPLLGNAT